MVNPSKYNGRIAAIGDAGASNIRYKPYGEVNRGNSYGPDIFRYKYTAQQEDIESGLYYYKSRYYDPNIGQFMQADSVIGLNTPLGTNQYAYTEGNPVRFTDPSGYMSYDSMMNRIWKDLTKAVIMEVSQQSDLASALTRMNLTKANVNQQKRLKRDSNMQLLTSTLKVVAGAVLFSIGFVNIGTSLMASGFAGLAGYAHGGGAGRGHFDHAKATQTSKVASGIVSVAFFVYSFVDFTMDPDIEAAGEVVAEKGPEPGWFDGLTGNPLTYYRLFWSPIYKLSYHAYYGINGIISKLTEQDLYLFPTKNSWWLEYPSKWSTTFNNFMESSLAYNPNLTELVYSGLNYPGNVSWLLFDLTLVSDLMSYTPNRREYNRYDNIGYYYDEMMRKGIYYTPYVIDFVNGEGVFAK